MYRYTYSFMKHLLSVLNLSKTQILSYIAKAEKLKLNYFSYNNFI
jgi:hypothetical protein